MLNAMKSWWAALAGSPQTFESLGEALEQHDLAQMMLTATASRYRASYLADGFDVSNSLRMTGGNSARRFIARELLLSQQGVSSLSLYLELSVAPAALEEQAQLVLSMRLTDLARDKQYAPVVLGEALVPLRTGSAQASLDAGVLALPTANEMLAPDRSRGVRFA